MGFLLVLLFTACGEKDPDEGDPSQVLIFESLVAEEETISPGDATEIKATASGYSLEYHWSASLGDILGSGATVQYATSPCHVGTNQVSCKVQDGNGKSETKTISIVVE